MTIFRFLELYTINIIKDLNRQFRKLTKTMTFFPIEQ